MLDYTDIKSQMIAERYRSEQNSTRLAGIAACKEHNLAVECYAGSGGLTEVYKKHFKSVINNDINQKSVAIHCMKAMEFITDVVAQLDQKVDLFDADCYGCPALEIQEFFKFADQHVPFVLCLSDGLGLWLKRCKREKTLRDRYLIEGTIDWHRIWDRHQQLVCEFIARLSDKHGLKSEEICSVQTKGKSYVLASYLISK